MSSAGGVALPPAMGVLLEDPRHSAVLMDFDGTLAPIVPDPETAEPLPGALEVVGALSERFAVVAVVSGRPVRFLSRHLGAAGPALRLFGGYGVERMENGVMSLAPEVEPWAERVSQVLDAVRAEAPAGLGVEDKGYALTLHWRQVPSTGRWASAFAERWAARTGLALQPGRRAVELRAPVGPDKGTVVEELGRRCRAACFAGDDAGDLAAFDALDRLATDGVAGVRLAVADQESPPELIGRADVVVEGPIEALAVLAALAEAAGSEPPQTASPA